MNSHQINLYLSGSDRTLFESALRKAGDFKVLDSITDEDALRFMGNTDILNIGEDRLKIYLVLPEYLELIRTNEVPNKNYKSVDVVRSPVIEFVRCYQSNRTLRRGRLYYVTGFYRDNVLVKKDKAFLTWAQGVFKFAKGALFKDASSYYYYGESALRLKEGGGGLAAL